MDVQNYLAIQTTTVVLTISFICDTLITKHKLLQSYKELITKFDLVPYKQQNEVNIMLSIFHVSTFFPDSLLRMSISGAVLIIVIILLRVAFINRLPKKTFFALWLVAMLRLILPFSIPFTLSVYSLFYADIPTVMVDQPALEPVHAPLAPPSAANQISAPSVSLENLPKEQDGSLYPWLIVYIIGAVTCAIYLIIAYARLQREFQMSLPVEHNAPHLWLEKHPFRRPVTIRQSDRILAPLTYGICRPVILMPKSFDWDDEQQLSYVLMHESVHIRRFDAAIKLIMAATVCIHWFNPMVWVMYILFNRDIELSCDEHVIQTFGETAKSSYALTLINMEEKKLQFLPFCSSFNKNAIEERITAIIKMKKISLFTALSAILLTAGVTVFFATTASPASKAISLCMALKESSLEPLTREESRLLFSVWLEDYENMTISDFQQTIWSIEDTSQTLNIVEAFSENSGAFRPEPDKTDAFLAFTDYFFSVYLPLTKEQWQTHYYSGQALSDIQSPDNMEIHEQTSLEYVLALTILDPETLTVSEYISARQEAESSLQMILTTLSDYNILTTESIDHSLLNKINELEERLSNAKLSLSVEYSFQLPSTFWDEVSLYQTLAEDITEQWDTLLSPYVPFGLTYQYLPDKDVHGLTMYYHNQEVRGIIDTRENIWITEHIGNTSYSSDAIELYAIYEEDQLVGLRPATEEEQKEWSAIRWKNSSTYLNSQDYEEPEARIYPNGSADDYASLLSLKTSTYQNQSVADFNQDILDWCNVDYDRMERIGTDAARNDYIISLTDEEKSFVELTFTLACEENYRYITSLNTKTPEEAAWINNDKWFRSSDYGAWCTLYYQISYQITDKDHLTVGERDRCIGGLLQEIQNFWDNTSLTELLAMSEADVVTLFQTYAEKHRHPLIAITVDADQIQFEHRGQ